MENQSDIGDQNTQQTGQNPIRRLLSILEGLKVNFWMVSTLVLAVLLVFGAALFLNSKNKQGQEIVDNSTPASATELNQTIQSTTPIDVKGVVFPFVRSGSIYFYDNGTEKLLVSQTQKSSQTSCDNLSYPFISPDKKYIAYIEQTGDEPGYGGCLGGILKLVYLDTGKIKAINYRTSYFKWNSSNQIVFSPEQERSEGPQTYTVKEVFYDPASGKETTFNVIIDQNKSTYADTMVSGEFPFNTNKLIRYKDNKYYLVDKLGNKEDFLLDKSQVESFLDWSPGGRYAIFESSKKSTLDFEAIELVIDTQDLSTQPKEIRVGRGGAGGEFSTGRRWYFEKGFVAYCSQDLYFIDGSKSLQLTNSGGGGCHNEDGFVATSPDGNYAFLKFTDRFELRSKNGDIKNITETTQLAKGRGRPKNLVWLDNDTMVIFQSTSGGGNSNSEPPSIYLFERKLNTIRPIVQDGYLLERVY
ncbi:hypothetical protein CMO96_02160 [Candidatus Woesebacteria bacterium]|nr:hypothetical protein [Candidatus Woesebacteria bacterium]|tara:strand:+ start:1068 stop:2480 length:1413 start_codon:yes stop_codon:yes gene_type:complete